MEYGGAGYGMCRHGTIVLIDWLEICSYCCLCGNMAMNFCEAMDHNVYCLQPMCFGLGNSV
eukprot:8464750-Ditylum_brightwellii.AAC.1